MLENDAKEKWCPFKRNKVETSPVATSDQGPIKQNHWSVYCIGSECMIWQSQEEPEGWKIARLAQIPLKSAYKFGYCGFVRKL